MKRVFATGVSLLCAILLYANGPVLTFLDKRILDYGDIKAGDPVEISIKFKNSGSEPLKILDVHPSCTCTDVIVPKVSIFPGEESSVLLKLETKGKKGVQVLVVCLDLNTERGYEIIRVNVNYV